MLRSGVTLPLDDVFLLSMFKVIANSQGSVGCERPTCTVSEQETRLMGKLSNHTDSFRAIQGDCYVGFSSVPHLPLRNRPSMTHRFALPATGLVTPLTEFQTFTEMR